MDKHNSTDTSATARCAASPAPYAAAAIRQDPDVRFLETTDAAKAA